MATRFTLPKETCPLIDKVIDSLETTVKEASVLLEQVRDANSSLREAAQCWEEEIEVKEDELDDALKQLKEIKAELESAEKELTQYKDERKAP